MLKDASRGRFDVVLAWALDRLGRSLIDLLGTLGELDAASVALVLHQQAIDTTTPTGRMFFQVTGAFAEFERGMIRSRVIAGLERARARGVRLGRPRTGPKVEAPRWIIGPRRFLNVTYSEWPTLIRALPPAGSLGRAAMRVELVLASDS